MTKISVIIPTYQSARYVKEAIESVLAQTEKDFEILVVDGGSTDGTLDVLSSFGNQIRLLTQNSKGVANARNVGVSNAQGEFIAFLDSDDLWVPQKLELQIGYLESLPASVALIYSDATFFESGPINQLDNNLRTHSAMWAWRPHRGKITRNLIKGNFITCSTVMIRKSCFKKSGLFDESFSICEDFDMWLRLSEFFEIDYQPFVLTKLRVRNGRLTGNLENLLQSQIALRNKIIREMSHQLNYLSTNDLNSFYEPLLNLGLLHLFQDPTDKKAKREIKKYIQLYPYNIKAYFLLMLAYFPFNLSIKLNFRQRAGYLYDLL